mgnify:CR=1 FL=1
MTQQHFAPKDAETLKSEIISDMGIEYEGNEDMVDKIVARELKDEEFKASLHADKNKHLESKKAYEERMRKAGIDPETGEKIDSKESTKSPNMDLKDIRALQDVHDDDIEEVIEFSKFKKISVAEAKRHPAVQSLLKTRVEERASALAASTQVSRRNNANSSGAILNKVKNQEDMSDEEMQLAVQATLAELKKK